MGVEAPPRPKGSSLIENLLYLVIFIVIVGVGIWAATQKTPGSTCVPDAGVANAKRYKYDNELECVPSSCKTGFTLTDGVCVDTQGDYSSGGSFSGAGDTGSSAGDTEDTGSVAGSVAGTPTVTTVPDSKPTLTKKSMADVCAATDPWKYDYSVGCVAAPTNLPDVTTLPSGFSTPLTVTGVGTEGQPTFSVAGCNNNYYKMYRRPTGSQEMWQDLRSNLTVNNVLNVTEVQDVSNCKKWRAPKLTNYAFQGFQNPCAKEWLDTSYKIGCSRNIIPKITDQDIDNGEAYYSDATFYETPSFAASYKWGMPKIGYSAGACPRGTHPVAIAAKSGRVVKRNYDGGSSYVDSFDTGFIDGYCPDAGLTYKNEYTFMRWNDYNKKKNKMYVYTDSEDQGRWNRAKGKPFYGYFASKCQQPWDYYYSFGCSAANPKNPAQTAPGLDINWSDAQKVWQTGSSEDGNYNKPLLLFYKGNDHNDKEYTSGGITSKDERICMPPLYLWIRRSTDSKGDVDTIYSSGTGGGFVDYDPKNQTVSKYTGTVPTVADLNTKSSCVQDFAPDLPTS